MIEGSTDLSCNHYGLVANSRGCFHMRIGTYEISMTCFAADFLGMSRWSETRVVGVNFDADVFRLLTISPTSVTPLLPVCYSYGSKVLVLPSFSAKNGHSTIFPYYSKI